MISMLALDLDFTFIYLLNILSPPPHSLSILALFIDVGENTSILDTSGNVFVFEQVKHHGSMDDWLNTQFCYVS